MSWDYRVVHQKHDNDEHSYRIHEAYYECESRDCHETHEPHSITVEPVSPSGETIGELKKDCENYMRALIRPILEFEDF